MSRPWVKADDGQMVFLIPYALRHGYVSTIMKVGDVWVVDGGDQGDRAFKVQTVDLSSNQFTSADHELDDWEQQFFKKHTGRVWVTSAVR